VLTVSPTPEVEEMGKPSEKEGEQEEKEEDTESNPEGIFPR
jgi:hypothetical protein